MSNELEILFTMISNRIDDLRDDIFRKIDDNNSKIIKLENKVDLIDVERIKLKQTWKTIVAICVGASSLSGTIGYMISKFLPFITN